MIWIFDVFISCYPLYIDGVIQGDLPTMITLIFPLITNLLKFLIFFILHKKSPVVIQTSIFKMTITSICLNVNYSVNNCFENVDEPSSIFIEVFSQLLKCLFLGEYPLKMVLQINKIHYLIYLMSTLQSIIVLYFDHFYKSKMLID